MNNGVKKHIIPILLGVVMTLVGFFVPEKVFAINVGDVKSFSYTGGVQVYQIEESGFYQLKTWGAQGGSLPGYYGGYGGYATGTVLLRKGTTVYVVVGGQGTGAGYQGQSLAGGYNGGGRVQGVGGINHMTGSGGGATHIATQSGLLSSLSNDRCCCPLGNWWNWWRLYRWWCSVQLRKHLAYHSNSSLRNTNYRKCLW